MRTNIALKDLEIKNKVHLKYRNDEQHSFSIFYKIKISDISVRALSLLRSALHLFVSALPMFSKAIFKNLLDFPF